MTNSKTTKRALFSSVMALLLCFTMLLGTTFAWFTDSVSSVNNVIKSGNLDVVLEIGTLNDGGNSANPSDYTWKEVDLANPIIELENVEPGYVATRAIRVRNNGSLALKFDLSTAIVSNEPGTNVNKEEFYLSDYLYTFTSKSLSFTDYDRDSILTMIDNMLADNFNSGFGSGTADIAINTFGETICKDMVLLDNQSAAFAFAVAMPKWVDNDANHDGNDEPALTFGINVIATQYTYENDSFDDQYDKDATYPELPEIIKVEGNDRAAVTDAIDQAKDGDIVMLTEDVDLGKDKNLPIEKPITIDLNNKTIKADYGYGIISLKNGSSIKNGTIEVASNVAAIRAFDADVIENITIKLTPKDPDKVTTGIAVQEKYHVNTIKNVTITGASQGIEIAYMSKVDLIENANVTAYDNDTKKGIALQINGGYVEKVVDSIFTGDTYGTQIHLKGVCAVGASFEKCTLKGTTAGLYAWDETTTPNNVPGSSLTINYDKETETNSGAIKWDFVEECLPVVKINGKTPVAVKAN